MVVVVVRLYVAVVLLFKVLNEENSFEELALTRRVHLYPRLEISVLMDISVLAFYGYIGYIRDISVEIFL